MKVASTPKRPRLVGPLRPTQVSQTERGATSAPPAATSAASARRLAAALRNGAKSSRSQNERPCVAPPGRPVDAQVDTGATGSRLCAVEWHADGAGVLLVRRQRLSGAASAKHHAILTPSRPSVGHATTLC